MYAWYRNWLLKTNFKKNIGRTVSYLRAAGKERFDVDVGVVDLEVVVAEPAGHADGGQHPRL